jgi:hypothetical protein
MKVPMTSSIRKRTMCLIFLLLLAFAAHTSHAQQLPKLVDGAHIRIAGLLMVEQRENRQFVMVKTKESYLAIFDADDAKQVRELGVELNGRQTELKALAGEQVIVSGKLQLESTSPYYFNGVLIVADSVRAEGSAALLPKMPQKSPPLPEELKQYRATVTFSAKKDTFLVKAWNIDGKPLASGPPYLSCGLNGPGDVMNCDCSDGFKPVAVERGDIQSFAKSETVTGDWSFAQFSLPDPAKVPVIRTVTCARK